MMNFDINRKVWGVIIFVIVNSLMALFWMFATQLEPPPRPNMIYNVVLLVAHILPWVVNLGLIITGLLAKQHEFVQGYVNVIGFVAALPFIFGGVFLAGCFVYMGFSIIFYLAVSGDPGIFACCALGIVLFLLGAFIFDPIKWR